MTIMIPPRVTPLEEGYYNVIGEESFPTQHLNTTVMTQVMSQAPIITERVVIPVVDPIEAQIESTLAREKLARVTRNIDRNGKVKKEEMQDFRFFPTHVETTINGVVKALSYLDFKLLLDSQLQLESKLDPIALPYNTFIVAQSTSELHLSCYYPGKKVEISYHGNTEEKLRKFKVAMPNVIISHKLNLKDGFWNLQAYGYSSKFFITDKLVTQISDNEIIYAANPARNIYPMPFPNFYDDGHMCFGGNSMPLKFNHNLRGLDYYYQVLSLSPFNNDLGIKGTKQRYNARTWFDHLASLDTFNYADMAGYRE